MTLNPHGYIYSSKSAFPFSVSVFQKGTNRKCQVNVPWKSGKDNNNKAEICFSYAFNTKVWVFFSMDRVCVKLIHNFFTEYYF